MREQIVIRLLAGELVERGASRDRDRGRVWSALIFMGLGAILGSSLTLLILEMLEKLR